MTFSKFSKRTRSTVLLVVIGLGLLAFAGNLWCQKVYSRPDNVFERMLTNALSTTSVTKQSVADNGAQHVVQTTTFHLAPDPRVHGIVDITQSGDQQSRVKRETLITTTTNFIRLLSVETNQKNQRGQSYDFSSVAGVWGQSPADDSSNSIAQLYGQNVAVPYASLTATARQKLMQQIEADGVYQVNYDAVKVVRINGRKAYEYPVSVKPVAFIKMMKALGTTLKVKGFEDVDANAYKSLPDVKFTFTVDVLSGDLVKVDYGNGQVEAYSGVGLRHIPADPKDALTMLELQQRLQKLQQ